MSHYNYFFKKFKTIIITNTKLVKVTLSQVLNPCKKTNNETFQTSLKKDIARILKRSVF